MAAIGGLRAARRDGLRSAGAFAARALAAAVVAAGALAPAAAQGLCLCLQCALGTHRSYAQAAGSMKPSVEPGDCVIARLICDDHSSVEPGRVVVYLHHVTDERSSSA